MTKNKICQNIFNIQRQFFESKKTINPKERIKSLKKLKIVISKNEEKIKKVVNVKLKSSLNDFLKAYNEKNK